MDKSKKSFPRTTGRWTEHLLLGTGNTLEPTPGVYGVYINGELVYVGSSSNVRNRFSGHAFRHGYGGEIITPWGEFSGHNVFTVKVSFSRKHGEWLMREARLIKKLNPMFNKRLMGRGRK